jgi:hypothetical protein
MKAPHNLLAAFHDVDGWPRDRQGTSKLKISETPYLKVTHWLRLQ